MVTDSADVSTTMNNAVTNTSLALHNIEEPSGAIPEKISHKFHYIIREYLSERDAQVYRISFLFKHCAG